MMRRYREMLLSAVALGVLLSAGCGPSTTNEDDIDRTKAGGPRVESNYAKFAQKQVEQNAQAQKEAKEAKRKGKPAPTDQPKPEPEQKSP